MRGVDNAAHIGGLLTGLILGTLIALLAPLQEHAPRRVAIFLATCVALAAGAAALARYHGVPLHFGRSPFDHPVSRVYRKRTPMRSS